MTVLGVGRDTQGWVTSYTPLQQLSVAPTLPWSVAGNASIGLGNWTATSAVCWFYARDLFDATKVPVGIISSNWGGTIIQSWADNATNARCMAADVGADPGDIVLPPGVDGPEALGPGTGTGPQPNNGHGVLFNSMIHPYTVGPMALTGFIWFQGESNCCNGPAYTCLQNGLIESWRAYFKNPTAFFGFVEMEPWLQLNRSGAPLAAFRVAQRASLSLPNVGYAAGTDLGDPTGPFTSIHPRNKKLVGKRLAAAALDIHYRTPAQWRPPVYRSSSANVSCQPCPIECRCGATLTVKIDFDNVPTRLVEAADHCRSEQRDADGRHINASMECAWFSISASDTSVLNATATIGVDGKSIVLTATTGAEGTTAVGSSFGMNSWPINTIKSAEGYPLRPWNQPLSGII